MDSCLGQFCGLLLSDAGSFQEILDWNNHANMGHNPKSPSHAYKMLACAQQSTLQLGCQWQGLIFLPSPSGTFPLKQPSVYSLGAGFWNNSKCSSCCCVVGPATTAGASPMTP